MDIKCHTKCTETFQYLHRKSSHPKSVFQSFITGEMHRYLRNSSNKPIYDTKLSDFKDKLMRRGYERSEIDKCYRKLKFNDRKDILYGTKTKPNVQQLMFVTKYHPDSGKLTKAVNKHWNLIEKNTYLSTLFPHKIMVTFKKGKNIADMITRNKL